jgi:hypothetical protein
MVTFPTGSDVGWVGSFMDNCPQCPLEANAGRVPADRADHADRPCRFGRSLRSSWRRGPSLRHSGERDASVQLTSDRLDAHRNGAPMDAGTNGVLSGDHASRTLNHRGTEPQGSERGYPRGSGFLAASEASLGALLAEPVQGSGVDPGHLGGPGIGPRRRLEVSSASRDRAPRRAGGADLGSPRNAASARSNRWHMPGLRSSSAPTHRRSPWASTVKRSP